MAATGTGRRSTLWLAWLAASLGLLAWLGYTLLEGDDKTVFMPGPLTGGHHQIGVACTACHTDELGDAEQMQKACVECHGDDRRKPFDSHPRAKFTDPRNADTLENINAQLCVTCHREHQPAMTGRNSCIIPAR